MSVIIKEITNPLHQLRYELEGQNAPCHVQLVYYAIAELPSELCTDLQSKVFKDAAKELFAELNLPIVLTRKDITHALRFLHGKGLLPNYVQLGKDVTGYEQDEQLEALKAALIRIQQSSTKR